MKKALTATATLIVVAVGGAAVVADVGLRDTESTTPLDQFSSTTADGVPALKDDIVALRIENKYHPLPWIGKDIGKVSCPGPLPAVVGATMVCIGSNSGRTVSIPVAAVGADAGHITWTFTR